MRKEDYTYLANNEEGNLYQIVLASVFQIGIIKSYLRRCVEKEDILDMDAYQDWINQLYEKWPISDQILSSNRTKKKNAGEVSITILAEVISWYYPQTKTLTIYSQDGDTYVFQHKADEYLKKVFSLQPLAPISYKRNDAILCQLYRQNIISIEELLNNRKDCRKLTYTKIQDDGSVAFINERVDHELFLDLVQDLSVHIVF